MSWTPVTLRWPEQATQWINGLSAARELASGELLGTVARLVGLEGLANTDPSPVAALAKAAVEAGQQALLEQFGPAPTCIAISPFQQGVGQGRGYQRFLSAPNLLQLLADSLFDDAVTINAHQPQSALALMFLSTRYDQLASALATFNAVLPIPELVRAERKALYLSRLEAEKWELPSASALPRAQPLPLERCTLIKAAKQQLFGQLTLLEGYTADDSPMNDLKALSARKAQQSQERDRQLETLKQQLADSGEHSSLRARLIGPGTPTELRRALLAGAAPGHEWVLCAGFMLVGPPPALAFVQELIGL